MIEVLVCILAGLGAGVGTGFAGMSAAAVISPMLITFLGVPAYEAIGIALASDVLARAASAASYAKNKNIDLKGGVVMMLAVLLFTVVGSWVSSLVPSSTMGGASLVMMVFLGIKFIVKPVMTTGDAMKNGSTAKRLILSAISGSVIGFICGFIGAGGGMMMLICLTSVLGYELKCAVGTSVFVMSFTALTGAVSHFAIGGAPNLLLLSVCVISTLVFALISSRIANKSEPKLLNRIVGIVLLVTGVAMLIFEFVTK